MLAFYHRGFELDVQSGDAGFAFAILHEGLALHASSATHPTSLSAERAARQFVDDALASFAYATPSLAA